MKDTEQQLIRLMAGYALTAQPTLTPTQIDIIMDLVKAEIIMDHIKKDHEARRDRHL
jgi:hypothetical protein